MIGPRHQRGVALLVAILLVAVGTILAATIAFQSAMAARRGTASMSFDESVLVAEGAEALAAYSLREDVLRQNNTDALNDDWARPFDPTEIAPGVVLTASVEDLQGRFNLNSLIAKDGGVGHIDPDALAVFQRLLAMVDLEPSWADKIADWIDRNDMPEADGMEDSGTTTQDPPYRVANTFITSTSELLALPGFGRERYLKLARHVVALPPEAKINTCTASPFLLDALVGPDYRYYSIHDTLTEDRKSGCVPLLRDFTTVADSGPDAGKPLLATRLTRLDQKSKYFRLTSLITIGDADFTLYSLLERDPDKKTVRVLQRSFTPD